MLVKTETLTVAQNGSNRAPRMTSDCLLGLTTPELERLLLAMGERPYRGRQLAEWIYRRGAPDFAT